MNRVLLGSSIALVLLTAVWLGGPQTMPDHSTLLQRVGSDPHPFCNAVLMLNPPCPTDPFGNPCGNNYNQKREGDPNDVWYSSLGTLCTKLPGCTGVTTYATNPQTCGGGT